MGEIKTATNLKGKREREGLQRGLTKRQETTARKYGRREHDECVQTNKMEEGDILQTK